MLIRIKRRAKPKKDKTSKQTSAKDEKKQRRARTRGEPGHGWWKFRT